jgi:hypothetical protein
MEVQQLSMTERMFFRDVIKTLLAWELMKEECMELDLVRRILDSEIKVLDIGSPENKTNKTNAILGK